MTATFRHRPPNHPSQFPAWRRAILGLAIVLGCTRAPAAAPDRFLVAAGTELRDHHGTGQPVQLRGVNLGGWLLIETWMCPVEGAGIKDEFTVRETLTRRFGAKVCEQLMNTYQDTWITERDLDQIVALGLNVVRVPFWYRTLQDEDGAWRADAFKRLDWIVENAGQRGLYVILDLHGVPGGQSDEHTTGRMRKPAETGVAPDFWNNEANLRRTTEIWQRLAQRYKGSAVVAAYDLINEPTGAPSREALWAVYDRLYRAIRAVDPDHAISVEGCWGGTSDGQKHGWGWMSLPPPAKMGWTNMLYQQHSYEWDWQNLEKQRLSVDRQVAEWKEHQNWNVPCLIGEFNSMEPEAAWAYALDRYSTNRMSWILWTYKAVHGEVADSWGVYNYRLPPPLKPDLAADSAEDIRSKWTKWGVTAFELNPMLKRVLARARAQK